MTHHALQSHGEAAADGKSETAVIDEIYSGPKASLRAIHDQVMAEVDEELISWVRTAWDSAG